MNWEKNYEVKSKNKILGRIKCTSNNKHNEFFCEISISDMKKVVNIKREKGLIKSFDLPNLNIIKANSLNEMNEKIEKKLNELYGTDFEKVLI